MRSLIDGLESYLQDQKRVIQTSPQGRSKLNANVAVEMLCLTRQRMVGYIAALTAVRNLKVNDNGMDT
jgi:hypothetical protein